MKRLPKILSLTVAIFFLLIGILHLSIHFQDLVIPEVSELLQSEINVMGKGADLWKMWQGFSFMMGISFITIGLINIVVLNGLRSDDKIPVGLSIIMILLLISVIYSGKAYFGPEQYYGGIVGLLMQTSALIISNKK